jgi:capsular exopolysaccharide synthesis family protein
LLLEYLDNTINSVEDVTRISGLSTLAVIPSMNGGPLRSRSTARELYRKKRDQPILQTSDSESVLIVNSKDQLHSHRLASRKAPAVEAYGMLRTSVLLSAAGRPPKSILVTSPQAGEGKTTTVINTAISLSQLGLSVLIIDADLRRPTAHEVLMLERGPGLSSHLSSDVEIDDLIQLSSFSNVSLLPAGSIPPNPAELVSSEKMRTLVQTMTMQYDHILIDSPPLVNVTDPAILSTMVEGVVLVVESGKSTREAVRRSRRLLLSVGAKVLGVVLNNFDLRHERYYGYYSYGYYSNGSRRERRKESNTDQA